MNYKESINELKSIIYQKVKSFNNLKKEKEQLMYETDLLSEVIDNMCDEEGQYDLVKIRENIYMIGLLLPLLYGDIVSNAFCDNIYRGLNAKEGNKIKINSVLSRLKQDYSDKKDRIKLLDVEIRELTPIIIEYKKILSNYKYTCKITNNQIDLIEDIMVKNEFTNAEQIKVLESIRINNRKSKSNDKKISYTVINILDTEYKKYDVDVSYVYANKEQFLKIIDSFYDGIKKYDEITEIFELLPSIDNSAYGYHEFVFIFESLINLLIDDLIDSKESISNLEIYKDYELRQVVIQEFNENLIKYRTLKNEYKKRKQQYLEIMNPDPIEEEKNIIFYQFLPENKEITYLERDIKKFPEEYLIKIKKLLEKKKYDKLQPEELKRFTSINENLSGYEELRDDQIRIFCKHLGNNCYCVIGSFVKKDDNPMFGFSLVKTRGCYVDISTPELFEENYNKSREAEIRLFDIIEKNARKGSR